MTEVNAFERRVEETLRWYADEVTPVVDSVAVAHRVAAAHPRRAKGALPWPRVAVPHMGAPLRLAWLLLLLAGLLIALVGGLLIGGSQPERDSRVVLPSVGEMFTCPPGTNPNQPGPVNQARPGELSPMALDRRAGKLVGVKVDVIGTPETWTFDVCTNTWTQMDPDQGPPHPVGPLVYDVDSDLTIGVFSDVVWAYDLQTDSWVEKGTAKGSPAVYDPVTGLVVTMSDDGLAYYDVDSDAWTQIDEATEPGPYASSYPFTYDDAVDRVVVYDGADTWLFDLRTGTWSRSRAETPRLVGGYGLSPPTIAYDETAARTVVLGFDPNVTPYYAPVSTYDAAADHWEIDDPTGFDLVPMTMVYDPVNLRLVGLAPQRGNDLVGIEGVMVGFDLEALEWTVLLELSGQEPVASPDPTPTPPSVIVTSDVAYESANPDLVPGELDVFAPSEAGPWPVVVMLHGAPGTASERRALRPQAHRVADLGYVVFNADWGRQLVGAGGGATYGHDGLVANNSQAACAVEFARAHAVEYGGDPDTMIVFGHSGGAHPGATMAFGQAEPSAGCLGSTTLGDIDALVTWEGNWLLSMNYPDWDGMLAADPRVLDVVTPWAHVAGDSDQRVVLLVSERPGTIFEREVGDPWAADSWLAVRDASGDLRRQLETNGAFADGILDYTEVQQLLYSVLEANGNPVSLDVMPNSTHTSLSDAGWEVFLAAFEKAAAQD